MKGRSERAALFLFVGKEEGSDRGISIIGIIIKKVARPKSDNLICESVDKMWDFKAREPEKPQKNRALK